MVGCASRWVCGSRLPIYTRCLVARIAVRSIGYGAAALTFTRTANI